MWEKMRRIWTIPDIRNRVIFVVLMLVIFRIAAHIPVPGINTEGLRQFLAGNQVLGLLNIFSGGTIQNFSIVMLGVAPYITASIIFQLLTLVVPRFEELSKEGESGQQKISMYTRIAAVPLALLQAFGTIKLLNQSQFAIMGDLTTFKYVSIMITITAGSIFLMWIGELITEKQIGNGTSLIIFAGIVASLPVTLQTAIVNYDPSQLYVYLLFVAMAIATIIGVVYVTEGQRNIPVSYARQNQGTRSFGGMTNFLPLRVNMAGVVPIIFAISMVLFPPMVAQFFVAQAGFIGRAASFVITLFNNQLFYGIIYFVFVFGFTYFYTSVVFNPKKMAENLQRQGAFILGVRPGSQTEDYLKKTMNKLLFSGALFLGLIAVLPVVAQAITGSQTLIIGGTGLLIVVSVAIETTKQLQSQLKMHEYDHV
jgi:preprotein translocase subunit SecY